MIFAKLFNRLFHRERLSLKHVFAIFSFVFVIWAFYRYFPEILPTWVEDLILKPLVWLVPTFWLVRKIEGEPLASLGITKKNLYPALYWGVGLGIVFALEGFLTNLIKYRGPQFVSFDTNAWGFLTSLLLSVATAISEETVFRGYIFTRLWRIWKKEWWANLVSALLFALIYLPVSVFVLGYRPLAMVAYLFFIFVYGFAAAFVFARTQNLLSSILLHLFWSWPILLFR